MVHFSSKATRRGKARKDKQKNKNKASKKKSFHSQKEIPIAMRGAKSGQLDSQSSEETEESSEDSQTNDEFFRRIDASVKKQM